MEEMLLELLDERMKRCTEERERELLRTAAHLIKCKGCADTRCVNLLFDELAHCLLQIENIFLTELKMFCTVISCPSGFMERPATSAINQCPVKRSSLQQMDPLNLIKAE